MATAREQLLQIRPQSEDVMTHLLDAYRDELFAEAADIASNEGMRLELEIGLEPARGARSAASRIRRAARAAQEPETAR